MKKPPDILYHFTCTDHGVTGIANTGIIRPWSHPLLAELGPIIWMTDLPAPSREAVGLSSGFLACDRLEWCFEITTAAVRPLLWWPEIRHFCNVSTVTDLEAGARPSHWWLTTVPIDIELSCVIDPADLEDLTKAES